MQLLSLESCLTTDGAPLPNAHITGSLSADPKPPAACNMTRDAYLAAVEDTKEHIRAGDVFQLVLSQRFERSTYADPFEVYRALRIVNPSPYMAYLQARSPAPHFARRCACARPHRARFRVLCRACLQAFAIQLYVARPEAAQLTEHSAYTSQAGSASGAS